MSDTLIRTPDPDDENSNFNKLVDDLFGPEIEDDFERKFRKAIKELDERPNA